MKKLLTLLFTLLAGLAFFLWHELKALNYRRYGKLPMNYEREWQSMVETGIEDE